MGDPRAKVHSADEPRDPQAEPPTVRPPFDPEEYARESESKIRLEATQATMPPPAAAGLGSGTIAALAVIEPDVVPLLVVARDDLDWYELEPNARSLLRHVDGQATIAAIARLAAV